METENQDKYTSPEQAGDPQEHMWQHWEKSHKRGKITGGLFIVAAGSLYLAKELGAMIPDWVFTWKMLLVAIGIMTGIKHGFRHPAWLVFVLVGGAFLMGDVFPGTPIRPVLWPILIIAFGLAMIFKPRRKYRQQRWGRHHWHQHQWKRWEERQKQYGRHGCGNPWEDTSTSSSEDHVESTTFMGGVKKKIFSKTFKGGDITNVFGGAEIDLMQADIQGSAKLDITNVFGGTKLIIPSHWEIKSELISVFGSIEDKRPIQPNALSESPKVLILEGTSFFGGIEIKSY